MYMQACTNGRVKVEAGYGGNDGVAYIYLNVFCFQNAIFKIDGFICALTRFVFELKLKCATTRFVLC